MDQSDCQLTCNLTEEIQGLRADLRVFHCKMFGEDADENPQGRIPRLEAQVKDHETRIGGLEAMKQGVRGMGWVAVGVIACVELIYHIFTLVRH